MLNDAILQVMDWCGEIEMIPSPTRPLVAFRVPSEAHQDDLVNAARVAGLSLSAFCREWLSRGIRETLGEQSAEMSASDKLEE